MQPANAPRPPEILLTAEINATIATAETREQSRRNNQPLSAGSHDQLVFIIPSSAIADADHSQVGVGFPGG
jgi:hypothetical protein